MDIKVQALRDIWAFADLIDFRGGAQNFYQLHRDMAEMNCLAQTMSVTRREYRRRIFLVPREHRKTTVNTVLYTLWRIYRNPDIRIIIMCCVKELALDMIREVKTYLEDPELIRTVWNDRPHIDGALIPRLATPQSNYKRAEYETEAEDRKVIWTAWAIQVNRFLKDKQPTLQALSVGMRPTGKHCDVVIMDDIVEWDNSRTPELAAKVQKSAHEIESVVTKKAEWVDICPGFGEWVGNEVIINGTRYYKWDFYSKYVGNSKEEQGKRLAKTGYSGMILDIYVNGVDNSDGYICPELFDAEVEFDLRERESITKREWYAQFRNIIISEQEQAYDSKSVRLIFPTNYRSTRLPGLVNFIDAEKPTENGYETFPVRLWLTVDLAISKKKRADNRAIGVGGWDELRRLHLVDAAAGQWSPEELYSEIHRLADMWNITIIHYETGVGMQGSFDHAFRTYNELHKLRTLVPAGLPVARTISKSRKIDLMLQPLIASRSLCVNSKVWQHTPFGHELEEFDPNKDTNQDNILDCLHMISQSSPMYSREQSVKDYGRHTYLNTMYGGVR